jgi:hypothetical protein
MEENTSTIDLNLPESLPPEDQKVIDSAGRAEKEQFDKPPIKWRYNKINHTPSRIFRLQRFACIKRR